MIDFFDRALNPQDIKYLQKELKHRVTNLNQDRTVNLKMLILFTPFVFGGTYLFIYLQLREIDNILILISGLLTVMGWPLLVMCLYKMWAIPYRIKEIRGKYQDLMTLGKARVIHCQSEKMIEFVEIEDEGAAYFFQVEEEKIFFLYGQDFYKTRVFPNTDFEIVDFYDKNGTPTDMYIHCTGKKLKPFRIIPAEEKLKIESKLDELLELDLIDGNVEKLDDIFDSLNSNT